jgi:hypothetical protein
MMKKKKRIVEVYDPEGPAWEEETDIYIVDSAESEFRMEQLIERIERAERALEDET